MRITFIKRPSVYIPLGLVAALVVLCAVVFNPGFQKKQLLARLGPTVDSLRIGRVHVTPWSTQITDVTVGYRGGTFHVDGGHIRYGIGSLILKKINLKRVALKGVRADLTGFSPPEQPGPSPESETSTGPFAGVLATLNQGFGIILDDVAMDARLSLPAGRSVTTTITGGGIRPETSGSVGFNVRFDTGTGDDRVDMDGTVRLDQLTGGRFNAVETTLAIDATLASLPQPERLSVQLSMVPAPATAQDSEAGSGADDRPRYRTEAIKLSLHQNDSEGALRAAVMLLGVYDGNDGNFKGDYSIKANEQLVQPYTAGRVVAPASETLTGSLAFNSASLAGELTVSGELLVTDLQSTYASEQLPDRLQMQNDFRVSLSSDRRLRVEKLETAVGHGGALTALTSTLTGDQSIALDDVGAFLRQDNTLLAFELPRVPLAWLNILLPGYEIIEGSLTGAFVIATDSAGAIHLRPQRPLEIAGLTVEKAGAPWLNDMSLSMSPSVSYSGEALRLSLAHLEVKTDEGMLVDGATQARLPLGDAQTGSIDASGRASVYLRNLTRLLGVDPGTRPTLPPKLELDFDAGVARRSTSTRLERLTANLSASGGDKLIRLALEQPLTLQDSPDGRRVVNPAGKLAAFNVSDIDLGWFSAFVPDGSLDGTLRRADFTLVIEEDGQLSVTPDRPFRLDSVTLTVRDSPIVNDLGIRVSPVVSVSPQQLTVRYEDFEVTGNGSSLVAGSGTVSLPRAVQGALAAEGRLDVDLQALARQPLVARLLGAELSAPVRLEADYALVQNADVVDIRQLAANVFYSDPQPRIALLAGSDIRVRTSLAADNAVADQARGELTLTVSNLKAGPFTNMLAARGLNFGAVNGKAVLSSDGSTMRVATDGMFQIDGIAVHSKDAALLEPFALSIDTVVDVRGNTLDAVLNRFHVAFPGDGSEPTVRGKAQLEIDGSGETARLSSLTGDATIALPALLRQPALMPGNKLTAGKLAADVSLSADGRIESKLRIDGLKAGTSLALQLLEAAITGNLEPSGRFALTAPVTTRGKSGVGDIDIRALGGGAGQGLRIEASSSELYLNDVLNTLNAIAGRASAAVTATNESATGTPAVDATPEPDDRQPDLQPFWSAVGDGVALKVDVQRLFYTDYLAIDGLAARLDIVPDRLTLSSLRATFHDSSLAADGTLTFAPGPSPYDLKLRGSVEQLDLATFFRELAPGSKPRAEGLFDFNIDAFGQSPNMAQYRNELFFDMNVASRDGVFRLLDPDSAIVASSTGITGAVGEIVSYVPTGLFGLGAVPRLVRYIKEIDYDKVDVKLVRDDSRDVQIRRFVVQSPEILMTASGGVQYREGLDILQSPLDLNARLDMRGEGAAIMYNMDLLRSEQNQWNYWVGPEFRFRGTPAVMESNLADVISQAGKGMIIGGISRPISGLIGNARHRWSDEAKPALEYDGAPLNDSVVPDATPIEADDDGDPPGAPDGG